MLYLFCYKALVALFLLKALWRCSGKIRWWFFSCQIASVVLFLINRFLWWLYSRSIVILTLLLSNTVIFAHFLLNYQKAILALFLLKSIVALFPINSIGGSVCCWTAIEAPLPLSNPGWSNFVGNFHGYCIPLNRHSGSIPVTVNGCGGSIPVFDSQ